MWMKIVGCLIFIIIFHCHESACGDVKIAKGFNISKNVTIHRNGHGRFLTFLKFLKSLHRAKKLHRPLMPITVSKLWRASFEFELKPHSVYPSANYYYPTQGPVGLTNSIESIFQFGDNVQQASTSIKGTTAQPVNVDIRDEISTETNQPDKQDAIRLALEMLPKENDIKSERFLRHADSSRMNEGSEESENQSTTTANDESAGDENQSTTIENDNSAGDENQSTTTANDQSVGDGNAAQPTQSVSTTTEPTNETKEIPPVTTEMAHETDSSSFTTNDHDRSSSTTSSFPTEWLGYDYGAHKPDFIEHVEFTTSLVDVEDIPYVGHYAPFRPSLPDYSNSFYPRFFVPVKYLKR